MNPSPDITPAGATTKTSPSVFIVVLTWNGKELTLQCLESLRRVEYPAFHVILVDNGSKDGTADEVRRLHPWVTVLPLPENLGFTGGNIRGADLALREGADYILLLNNDTEVAADFLGRLIDVAEQDRRIGALSPLLYFHDKPDRVQSAGGKIGLLGLHNQVHFFRQTDRRVPDLCEPEVLNGAALCIPRDVIKRVGFLDDLYFAYYEDVDLCHRIRNAGYKLAVVKSSKVWHKVSAATGSHFNPVNQYLMARGNAIYLRKYAGVWAKIAFPVVAAAALAYVTVRELFRGNARAALPRVRGYLDGWKRKPLEPSTLEDIRRRFAHKHHPASPK